MIGHNWSSYIFMIICMMFLSEDGLDNIKYTNMKLPKPSFVLSSLHCIIWCSCYIWSSFNLGLKMERKLKTQNTQKLREILWRRFTSFTSLTLAWEMMEHTLLLLPTVRERVARPQNSTYIVSRFILSIPLTVDIDVPLSCLWNLRTKCFNPLTAITSLPSVLTAG